MSIEDTSVGIREGTEIGNSIRIAEKAGQGSMGVVWRAWRNGIPLAVKFPIAAFDQVARDPISRWMLETFRRESVAICSLRSEHIVRGLFSGTFRDLPYFAMEYVSAPTLLDCRNRRWARRWSLRRAFGVARQIALALCEFYRLGWVHRDLASKHIFLLPQDRVKLYDFSIATQPGQWPICEAFEENLEFGPRMYVSPEQLRKTRSLDHRADQWSLASIVYNLCTDGLGTNSDPWERLRELPSPAARLLRKAGNSSPEKRFKTPMEVLSAIEKVLSSIC